MEALDRLTQRKVASELAARAAFSQDLTTKWRYIDDLIDIMDPGDDFKPWPKLLWTLSKELSPLVHELIGERLKKRRKKLHDKLKERKSEENGENGS